MIDREIEDKIYVYLKKELGWNSSWNWRVLQVVRGIVKIVQESSHEDQNNIKEKCKFSFNIIECDPCSLYSYCKKKEKEDDK